MVEFLILFGAVAGLLQLYFILAWWGNGCLKGSEAVFLFCLDIILLFVLIGDHSGLVRFVAILLLLAPYVWIHFVFNPDSIKNILEEEIEKYRRAITTDPRNLAAREYLAKTLYKTGDISAAIDEMKTLITMTPNNYDLAYHLKNWEEEKREKDTGMVMCPHCKTENEGSRKWCRKCESPISAYRPKSWMARLSLKGFLVLFASLVVIVASFAILPAVYALIPIGCLLLAICGWRLVISR